MNSQQFLLINIAILSFFIIWFLAGRRGSSKKATRLNMKQGNQTPGGVLQKNQTSAPTSGGRYSHPRYQKYLEDVPLPASSSKDLNVLFNYNGHSWDAYEVLGVPAGSSLVEVTKAYQGMLKTADPDSHEFLETAFKSILARK